MEVQLDESFWNARYVLGETAWDMGQVSTPLKTYIDKLSDKTIKVLVPGAGNAWEAAYLWDSGFRNVWICDIAREAIERFKKRRPDFPANQLIHSDFFQLEGTFDLVLEQTFFCAIDPSLRLSYAKKMSHILNLGGTLAGVFFDIPENPNPPPFAGNAEEYRTLFSPYFKEVPIAPCYNSIKPREGREVFVILKR
jgi:thiopurine S-methyltransferase